MKWLFLLCFLGMPHANLELSEIRKMYPAASNSESSAKEFEAKLAAIALDGDPIFVAYKGASITMVSKFGKNLNQKIKQFKEGVKWMESAVNRNPNNIEIRFIRLSVQENVPRIAKYRSNINEDAKFLVEHYKEQNGPLKEYLKSFMLQSKSIPLAEKQMIK